MKMEPIECSKTLAFNTQTPGRYPKENALHNYCCVYQSNVGLLCVSFEMCLCAVVIRVFDNLWRTAGHTPCAGRVTGSHKIAVTCALSA